MAMQEPQPFAISSRAVAMAKKKLLEVGDKAVGLRLGVKGGGCSGYTYVFDVAEKVRPEKDLSFWIDDLQVVVDRKSLEFLRGCRLDWETKLMGYGFRWENPQAKAGCGCGTSFRV